jgi:NAD(P)H-flavin reductase
MPYSISSAQEFEELVQIIKEVGIKTFMERKLRDKEKREWSFGPFIRNEFSDESKRIQFLFPDEYNEMFPKEIRSQLPT